VERYQKIAVRFRRHHSHFLFIPMPRKKSSGTRSRRMQLSDAKAIRNLASSRPKSPRNHNFEGLIGLTSRRGSACYQVVAEASTFSLPIRRNFVIRGAPMEIQTKSDVLNFSGTTLKISSLAQALPLWAFLEHGPKS